MATNSTSAEARRYSQVRETRAHTEISSFIEGLPEILLFIDEDNISRNPAYYYHPTADDANLSHKRAVNCLPSMVPIYRLVMHTRTDRIASLQYFIRACLLTHNGLSYSQP